MNDLIKECNGTNEGDLCPMAIDGEEISEKKEKRMKRFKELLKSCDDRQAKLTT